MKSHSILRTNVGLTSNIKVMVGTTYSLYMDSIDSHPDLSDVKYKKVQFTKDSYWDELIPFFFTNTPINTAFTVKYDNDNSNMGTDFSNQYDDLYQYGALNIIDNSNYDEDYEYFAPLYISKLNLPTNFVIFRIDGPGLITLNKDNFRSEVINNLKCVKCFDLTKSSPLGEWLDTNITSNKSFPINSFYMDFRANEFSSWFGIDYDNGGYSEKAFMLDSMLNYENTYNDFESMIYNGFKNNKVVYPHIINFSFLFDDNPATPTSLRSWSLNRYMGFYMDNIELVKYVSPYQLPAVKTTVVIDKNNILYDPSNLVSVGSSPFVDSFKSNDYPYIEIGGNFYRIEKYLDKQTTSTQRILGTQSLSSSVFVDQSIESNVTKYKIISNISLAGRQSEINKNTIFISTDINGSSRLSYSDGSTFSIDGFGDADVWMIQIDSNYHTITIGVDGEYYLRTDYGFDQSYDKFDYYINDPDPNYRKSLSLIVDSNNPPKKFGIYKCKFTDIKDFDTDIVETQFSKHEYMKTSQLTLTDETKMYATNYQSTSIPNDLHDYKISGVVVNIPASSEYTANGESFRIVDNDLSSLWRKNPIRAKWGFHGSLSSNDYPYLLNNSFSAEDYNRSVNVDNIQPNRHDRNLDYFLSVNSSSAEYSHHSLHVQNSIQIQTDTIVVGGVSTPVYNSIIDTSFTFDLDKYLNINYDNDYFSYFFNKKSTFDSDNIVSNTTKYSYFAPGDSGTPNVTVFKGLKFQLFDVSSIKVSNGQISTVNISTSNTYDGYMFSLLLSKNNYDVSISNGLPVVSPYDNILRWSIIDDWKMSKIFDINTVSKYSDILYISNTQSQILDPTINPSNSSDWSLFTSPSIFWSPLYDGTNPTSSNNMYGQFGSMSLPPLVYNAKDYYYSSGSTGSNFWNPTTVYNQGDSVQYNNIVWQSITSSNSYSPPSNNNDSVYWISSTTIETIWSVVEIWRLDREYSPSTSEWSSSFDMGHYVYYDGIVWATVGSPVPGVIPQNDNNWVRIYSILPDTSFEYSPSLSSNDIIEMNNRYYWCYQVGTSSLSNPDQTLNNGINIYINNLYQNVLINIYVNDNTYDNLSNTDRDDLYTDLYSKITANNFMNSMNDLSNKYDFSDNIKYIIINPDSTINIYDFNDITTISSLPTLLKVEGPDQFVSRIQSLDVEPVSLSTSQIKPIRKLDLGNITSLDQINYYSDEHLATSIVRKTSDANIIPNYSGLKNNIFNIMNRHSGPYSPIFNVMELFRSSSVTQSFGNYVFDTDLTNFGTIKEMVISKVNRNSNVLKLRNNTNIKSIYPMLDEFGYQITDFFIFKSTWDFEYYVECSEAPQLPPIVANQSLVYNTPNNNTNSNNLNLL